MDRPQIDQGVPIPQDRKRGSYLFMTKMRVGESFLYPGGRQGATGLASRYFGVGKYSIRSVDGGFRIWRTG